MDQLLINDINGTSVNAWGLFYTNNGRFYAIYTKKEKDQNGYILLNVVKVLKEVINTPTGTQVTGKYVGVEITDQAEWELVKADISAIIANKQSGNPTTVQYLNTVDINGISIKSFKEFKLREDVVNSLIPADQTLTDVTVAVNNQEVVQPAIVEPAIVQPAEPVDIVPQPVVAIPGVPATEAPINADLEVNNSDPIISNPDGSNSASQLQSASVQTNNVVESAIDNTPINPFDPGSTMNNNQMNSIVLPLINPLDQSLNNANEINSDVIPFDSVGSAPSGDNGSTIDPFASSPVAEQSSGVINAIPTGENNVQINPFNVEKTVDSNVEIGNTNIDMTSNDDYQKMYLDAIEQNKALNAQIEELQNKLNSIKNIIE